jgi:hypothetical protein
MFGVSVGVPHVPQNNLPVGAKMSGNVSSQCFGGVYAIESKRYGGELPDNCTLKDNDARIALCKMNPDVDLNSVN